MAREGLDVTTVIFNNRSYAILNMELNRVGADSAGPKAKAMLDLSRPDLDFVALAKGMGLPALAGDDRRRVQRQLERALATPGPSPRRSRRPVDRLTSDLDRRILRAEATEQQRSRDRARHEQ